MLGFYYSVVRHLNKLNLLLAIQVVATRWQTCIMFSDFNVRSYYKRIVKMILIQ